MSSLLLVDTTSTYLLNGELFHCLLCYQIVSILFSRLWGMAVPTNFNGFVLHLLTLEHVISSHLAAIKADYTPCRQT